MTGISTMGAWHLLVNQISVHFVITKIKLLNDFAMQKFEFKSESEFFYKSVMRQIFRLIQIQIQLSFWKSPHWSFVAIHR